MSNLAFNISERSSKEKASILRKNGQVPCVIYGGSLDNAISAKISKNELLKLMGENTQSSMIPLVLDGETKTCVVKELQKDVYGKVIHVDFQSVSKNELLRLKVPVSFVGMENLETKRLVLETFTPEIEIQGIASNMPENLEVNVSDMNFGDKVFAKNISLPKDISLITESETLLAVIAGTDAVAEDEEAAENTEEN